MILMIMATSAMEYMVMGEGRLVRRSKAVEQQPSPCNQITIDCHFDQAETRFSWITWSEFFVWERVVSQRKAEIGVGRMRKIGAEGDWLLCQATSQAVVSTNTSTNPTMASTSLLTSKVVAKLRSFLG